MEDGFVFFIASLLINTIIAYILIKHYYSIDKIKGPQGIQGPQGPQGNHGNDGECSVCDDLGTRVSALEVHHP